MRPYTLSDFDFVLPPALIAQHPASERSAARLLDGTAPAPADRIFRDLPALLRAGDLLVFNDTQVIKARLYGEKPSGGKVELLVERVLPDGEVVAHMKASKKPAPGAVLQMAGSAGGANAAHRPDGAHGFRARLLGRWPDERGALFRFAFDSDAGEDPYALMARHGHVPLPPYIAHADSSEDARRYQSVFARVPGAVAAPTAALHFDKDVLAALAARGVQRASVTLHVGAGTFQPVKTEHIAEHTMHAERYDIPPATQQAIAQTRARGGRIVAVGTTTVRTLESWAASGQAAGETRIFITPGFVFKHIDLLITNFHLPKSTLMMLVSAFAGYEHVMALYAHAIGARYRFFSYGDAMLLQRAASCAALCAESPGPNHFVRR
ncbi:MAG: tRNA preQ1(34) S-adenosylmethionine ribosyltransferase-isomerase QueA [Burkholderiaceae bacterium]|nr:tRNA preQ1(34) S-adenosylmethionine ribosyltransferase-isomerase QueA [Burkholderiaceae bacterium]